MEKIEKRTYLSYKDLWIELFKFLDINDYFNLELSNKTMRNQLLSYFKMHTKNLSTVCSEKNLKKLFLSKYMNSFIIFNVKSEYNSMEEFEQVKELTHKVNTPNIANTISNMKKSDLSQSQFIDNTQIKYKLQDNSLFSQEILIKQIIIKENKLFALYENFDLKIFTIDSDSNLIFEMKFNFSYIKIKNFVFLKEKSSFIIIDEEGKIYSFYYPTLEELAEQNNNEVYLTLSQISDINMLIQDIYAIKDYLLILDNKGNFYYAHVDCLGLNYFKDDILNSNKITEEIEKVEINKEINLEEQLKETNEEEVRNCIEKTIINPNSIKIYAFERNYGNIIKIASSDLNIMFVDDNYKIYYINSSDLNKPGITSHTPKILNFEFKLLQDIACGDSHWLVLERDEVKAIEKWNENDVQTWFHSMDMDEFLNIIKYEKINGKDILNADEAFFVNVMGMEDDQIKKVKYELNNVKNISCKKTKLWGWGSNKQGQLGQINYNNTFVKSPTNINIPDMKHENDYIVKVLCGKTFSLALTKFGEIYITGNYSAKEKSNNTNFQQNYNSNNQTGGKKNKVVEKNKQQNLNPLTCNRWVNITKEICFDSFGDQYRNQNYFFRCKEIIVREMKIFFFGYKSNEIPFTLQAKKPKLKHLKKGDKFPTSDIIVEQILAKKKKQIDKFLIVYEDALLKFLETPLLEFLESEVPYHKIIQIKFFNNIIWDRKKRYFKTDYD